MLQFVIWGCGYRGRMLLDCMDKKRIKAFIDKDSSIQGTRYKGIPIISFQSYLDCFSDCYIIVSVSLSKMIVDEIQTYGIVRYFVLDRCPSELPYYGERLPFGEMLSTLSWIKKHGRILIAGINLFSILLYEYMQKMGYDICLYNCIQQRTIANEISKDLSYIFEDDNGIIEGFDSILITDSYLDKIDTFHFSKSIPFYRFPYLKRYRYRNLNDFHNIHKGMRCFVIATGPSLKIQDLDKLNKYGEKSFSVNNVYKCFNQTTWRPDYLVISDMVNLEMFQNEILNADIKGCTFVSDRSYPRWKNINSPQIYVFHSYYEYYGEEGPNFSSRIDEGVHYGHTVIFCALQLAAYMGFKEIYLLGADCDYASDGNSETDHFIPNYSYAGELKVKLSPFEYYDAEEVLAGYKAAKNYADAHGIKIFNATRGGKLEVFPRVAFDSLFD